MEASYFYFLFPLVFIGETTAQTSIPFTAVTCNSSQANQQVILNNGLYWCGSTGKVVPLACLSPDGSRIDMGSSFWTSSAVLECKQQGDSLLLQYTACLIRGQRVDADKKLTDGSYSYQCLRTPDGTLKLNLTGCIGDDGKEVAIGSEVGKDSAGTYKCDASGATENTGPSGPTSDPNPIPKPTRAPNPANPGPRPQPTSKPQPQPQPQPNNSGESEELLQPGQGCMFLGKKYEVDADIVQSTSIWYKCLKNSTTPTMYGCVVEGKKYKTGDTYTSKFLAFRCQKVGGPFPTGQAYACVERYLNGTVAIYEPGKKWLTDNGNVSNNYVATCQKEGITLKRFTVGCYYHIKEGQGVLVDACMKAVGPVTIQCWPFIPGETANNRIKISPNPVPAEHMEHLKEHGIKYCESQPLLSVINAGPYPPYVFKEDVTPDDVKLAPSIKPGPQDPSVEVISQASVDNSEPSQQPQPHPQPQPRPNPQPQPVHQPKPAPQPSPQPQPQENSPTISHGIPGQGCNFNGKHYNVDDDITELAGVWYKCTKDSANPVMWGCIVDGTKYKLGDTFQTKFMAFRCAKLNKFPAAQAYACVERYRNGTIREYPPGKNWLSDSGDVNNNYVLTCQRDGLTLKRYTIGCYYHVQEGEGVLDDSCMKSVGSITIQCWPYIPGETANNRIKITQNPPSQHDLDRFKKAGLKYCEPKPVSSVLNGP